MSPSTFEGLASPAAELLTPPRVMPLGAGSPNLAVRNRLASVTVESLNAPSVRIVDRDQAASCLAGLWLLHDFLDEAHRIVQAIERPEASYWHAIVHRREGDYSNTKYWNREAGELPIFAELAEFVRTTASQRNAKAIRLVLDSAGNWEPDRWVDAYRDAYRNRAPFDEPSFVQWAIDLQQTEWQILMHYCWHRAIGRGPRS